MLIQLLIDADPLLDIMLIFKQNIKDNMLKFKKSTLYRFKAKRGNITNF